ncbi:MULTISPECIES: hypothetical protein [unclassified Streptomyces]|uniref:hypothetical protein n=1 Tax=unclassified Streptomyces TaxID=2593676 RepID=UPI002E17861B|nr:MULTISPECIES: hypothetical protein [unclassified Streptomyces]
MARLPALKDFAALTPVERDTLRDLNLAHMQVEAQWELAKAATHMAMAREEAVDDAPAGSAVGPFHRQALDDAASLASEHDDAVEDLLWRYASSTFVLAMRVVDRILCQAGPLPAEQVHRVAASEPTLGELEDVVGSPLDRLCAARSDWIGRRDERDTLRHGVEAAYSSLLRGKHAASREAAAQVRLLSVREPRTDPPYEVMFKTVLEMAEAVPYNIAQLLQGPEGTPVRNSR